MLSPQPSVPLLYYQRPPAHPVPAAWELVAGEEAYRGWHPMQIVLQVTQHGTRPPALPHCPPALAALMARCWNEASADRWGEGSGSLLCNPLVVCLPV